MTTPCGNITDPMEIKHALERKLGYGAIKKIAEESGSSPPVVSNNISGRRHNIQILRIIAAHVGNPVHGVDPDDEHSLKTC